MCEVDDFVPTIAREFRALPTSSGGTRYTYPVPDCRNGEATRSRNAEEHCTAGPHHLTVCSQPADVQRTVRQTTSASLTRF